MFVKRLSLLQERHDLCGLAVGAEDFLDLVLDEFADVVASRRDVLARIEVLGMLLEVLADARRHGEAQVGVDVDLADCRLRRFSQLILGNAYGVGEIAVVVVDDLDVLGNDGRGAVQYDGEARQTLFDFREDVEAQFGRYEHALGVLRALFGLELEGAVARADGDREGVDARA